MAFRACMAVIVVLLCGSGALAQTTPQEEPVTKASNPFDVSSVSFKVEVWDKYLFSNGFVANDGPVVQGNFNLSCECGLYLNLWGSLALDNRDQPNFGDEVDYTVGYANTFDLGSLKDISFDVSASYYDLANVFEMPRSGDIADAVQFAAEVSKSFDLGRAGKISPYLRGEVLFGLDGQNTGEFYAHAGVRHRLEILEKTLSINQRVTMVYDSGGFGFQPGFIGGYGVGLEWNVAPNITVTPVNFKLTVPIDVDDRDVEYAVGAGISFKF